MNILRILFFCFSALILSSCATKTSIGAEEFKGYTAKQLLLGGEKSLKDHSYKDAIKFFEAIDILYPFEKEAIQGQMFVIYAYYKADDYDSAIAAADRYIHMYPISKYTDYVYYMKGLINFEKNRNWLQKIYTKHSEELDLVNLKESFVNFDILLKKFPNSPYAKDAEKRMLYIRNLLGKNELHIAKFYYERKAYVAAANRASYIVKHLEGAPQTAEALKLMIKCYRELGANKQADDAARVLNLNFPSA
jgi:outer membrane protein assembly factor BamD